MTPTARPMPSPLPDPRRLFALLALLLWALAAGGCASLPSNVVREPSLAVPPSTDTTLGRIAAESSPDPALSGFRLLPVAAFAIDTRLQLARRAERSLDVQYYHIADDATGRILLRTLRDAAQRGVRVRLLVDDLYTEDLDDLLLGLAAHPHVEVRLFNPFPGGRAFATLRWLRSLNEFSRVNRRMHNKLFVADGVMAVSGGRNIADEYFMRHEQANFVDLDTFATGPLVTQLEAYFDDYWNSPVVFPLQSIVHDTLDPGTRRAQFERLTAGAAADPPMPPGANDVLGYGPIADDLDSGRLGLVWAPATAYADAPAHVKGMGSSYALLPLEDVESVRYNVLELMRGAKREVLMTTPYMIPGDKGMALFAELRQRGVKLRVLTNSLAATDEPLVHIGYSRYRVPMLKLGVELHELSPGRSARSSRLMLFKRSRGRLHAKTAVIDRRAIFLGSMNFDPRSEKHNTEMGMFIESPQLAREMLRLMDLDKLQASYQVILKPDGSLRWVAADKMMASYDTVAGPDGQPRLQDVDDGDEPVELATEPEADPFTRLMLRLLAPLAPEELL